MKTFLKKKLFVVIAVGFIFGLLGFLYSANIFNGKSILLNVIQNDIKLFAAHTTTSDQQGQEKNQLPVRLKIPSINIDAPIEYVGLTTTGAMDVPKNRDDVAWFSPGIRPGENGTAVIVGHSGYKVGTAVFDNLNKLRKGDIVYVENMLGKSIPFVVQESRLYDSNAYAPEVFESSSGKHLNLITCTGSWDNSKKSYNERLVVFTDIVQ